MAKRANPVKPLNEPIQVAVRQDRHGMPVAVELVDSLPATKRSRRSTRDRSRWLNVDHIEDIYEVDELWWRGEEQEIRRLYFDLRLGNSRRITVYRDLLHDTWHRQAD